MLRSPAEDVECFVNPSPPRGSRTSESPKCTYTIVPAFRSCAVKVASRIQDRGAHRSVFQGEAVQDRFGSNHYRQTQVGSARKLYSAGKLCHRGPRIVEYNCAVGLRAITCP